MTRLPHFIIIGAMKSATTTLYNQLVAQSGIFMCSPKEPNYFSDDAVFDKGERWYSGLFEAAQSDDLLGEASTHYTKLPTYPHTLRRMTARLPQVKAIYVMRHPVDRLISQYIHEWTEGRISVDINRAIDQHPELLAYSRYAYQLQPYFEVYGQNSVLPVFFENVKNRSQNELDRVCQFIGYKGQAKWQNDLQQSNVSNERIRRFPLYRFLIESPFLVWCRRNLVPKSLRNKVKKRFQMRERPTLNQQNLTKVEAVLNEDLAVLGNWLGVELNCQNYHGVVTQAEMVTFSGWQCGHKAK